MHWIERNISPSSTIQIYRKWIPTFQIIDLDNDRLGARTSVFYIIFSFMFLCFWGGGWSSTLLIKIELSIILIFHIFIIRVLYVILFACFCKDEMRSLYFRVSQLIITLSWKINRSVMMPYSSPEGEGLTIQCTLCYFIG